MQSYIQQLEYKHNCSTGAAHVHVDALFDSIHLWTLTEFECGVIFDCLGLLNIWRRLSGDPGRRLTHVYNTYSETTYTAV